MKLLRKLKIACTHPKQILELAIKHTSLRNLPDSLYLRMIFKLRVGYSLNLEDPRGFNEKLQWLKLNDRKPEYTKLVDKYEVRDIIADRIGEKYLVPLLGVWNHFGDIDFSKLPDQFVLKCTHDSGGVVICTDKSTMDMAAAKEKISKCLQRDFYRMGREYPYRDVKHRIIAEAFLKDEGSSDLLDYKFMCFNGKVKCSFVCSNRNREEGLNVTFFDNDWNQLPFERHYPVSKKPIPKPLNLDEMICLSEKLSEGMKFVRVDFYEVSGKIYFGELTLYPGSGMEEFTPREWDFKMGDWLDLQYHEI